MLKSNVIFCYKVSLVQLCPILINQNDQLPSCCRYPRVKFLALRMRTVIDPAERRWYLIFRAALLRLSLYNIDIWPASNIKNHQLLAGSITVSIPRARNVALRYRQHDGNWFFRCLKIRHKCTSETFVTKSHVRFKAIAISKCFWGGSWKAEFNYFRIHQLPSTMSISGFGSS